MSSTGVSPGRGVFVRLKRRWYLHASLEPGDTDPLPADLTGIAMSYAQRNSGTAPVVRVLDIPATHRAVVATLWSGPVTLSRLGPGEPDPVEEELAYMAELVRGWGGDEPQAIRVLEVSALRGAPFGVPGTTPAAGGGSW